MMPTTGYSAPASAEASLYTSATSSSSINVVYPPKKILRGAEQAPAAPALTTTMENIAEHSRAPRVVHSTSSSELQSIASSQEHDRRFALAKARRGTTKAKLALTQMQVYLAEADQELAESEFDAHRSHPRAGSIGRLANVENDGGNPTHSRQ